MYRSQGLLGPDGDEGTPGLDGERPASTDTGAPGTVTVPGGGSTSGTEPVTGNEPADDGQADSGQADDGQRAVSAVFEPVKEGPFDVTRSWKVTDGGREIVGVIIVTRVDPGSGDDSLFHPEAIPAGAVADEAFDNLALLQWSPDPLVESGFAARYRAGHLAQGESLEIEFRAPLRQGETVTGATMLSWFDEWKKEPVKAQSPLGGDYADIVVPRIEGG